MTYVPSWACSQWGQYEHDWIDCPECNEAYEKYLEDGEKGMEMTFHDKLMLMLDMNSARFTAAELGTLLIHPINLVEHEYYEYKKRIEEIYDKVVMGKIDSPLKESIEKFSGKIQETK